MKIKYFVFFLNLLYFTHAVPQIFYPPYTDMDETNPEEQITNQIFSTWKKEVDQKIDALEKITDKLEKKLKEMEIDVKTTEVGNEPQGTKNAASEYSINLSNVTVKIYGSDIKHLIETNENRRTTENLIEKVQDHSTTEKYTESVEDHSSTEEPVSSTFEPQGPYCYLNIEEASSLQPLTLTPSLGWPPLMRNEAGSRVVRLARGQKALLICPNRFFEFFVNNVTATCDEGTTLRINGRQYEYSDVKCIEEITHVIERTGQECFHKDTEKVQIVYKSFNTKIVLYEMCRYLPMNDVIYTKHYMHDYLTDDEDAPITRSWTDANQFVMNFDEGYNCTFQTDYISQRRGDFHTDDRCCFSRRQLVSYKDLYPGIPQRAAFSYMNVAPQWSTCNSENWDEIERRVRNLAKSQSPIDLVVWTGVKYEGPGFMFSGNGSGGIQYTPPYFWKVVQDRVSASSLAVITVNAPDLSYYRTSGYSLCTDICDSTGWMDNSDWADVSRGYTYCCTIDEFENAFGFNGIFQSGLSAVLKI